MAKVDEKTSNNFNPQVHDDLRLLIKSIGSFCNRKTKSQSNDSFFCLFQDQFNGTIKDHRIDSKIILDLQQLIKSSRWSREITVSIDYESSVANFTVENLD